MENIIGESRDNNMPANAGSELGCGLKRLNFLMQKQQKSCWCWAATAVSVSGFFNPNTNWTQCFLVNAVLGRDDCCLDRSGEDCDKTEILDIALKRTGNYQSWKKGANTADIKQEILANRPLCAHISWADGGGHFVAITGFHSDLNTDLNRIYVSDPFFGDSNVDVTTFLARYKGDGTWDETIWVCPCIS
jgi:hypothetical protein